MRRAVSWERPEIIFLSDSFLLAVTADIRDRFLSANILCVASTQTAAKLRLVVLASFLPSFLPYFLGRLEGRNQKKFGNKVFLSRASEAEVGRQTDRQTNIHTIAMYEMPSKPHVEGGEDITYLRPKRRLFRHQRRSRPAWRRSWGPKPGHRCGSTWNGLAEATRRVPTKPGWRNSPKAKKKLSDKYRLITRRSHQHLWEEREFGHNLPGFKSRLGSAKEKSKTRIISLSLHLRGKISGNE